MYLAKIKHQLLAHNKAGVLQTRHASALNLFYHTRLQAGVSSQDPSGSVGDVETSGRGFAVGTAPLGAKPAYERTGNTSPRARASSRPMTEEASPDSRVGPSQQPGLVGTAADRNAAFARFKKELDEGKALSAIVQERSAHLTDIKKGIKDAAAAVNAAKAEIDAISTKLGSRKALRGPEEASGEDVVDAEHWSLTQVRRWEGQGPGAGDTSRLFHPHHRESCSPFSRCLERLGCTLAQ